MFYRLATKEDFERVKLKNFKDFPSEVKKVIENIGDADRESIIMYRNIKGTSLYESRDACEAYAAYWKAYQDFLKGVPVYTQY